MKTFIKYSGNKSLYLKHIIPLIKQSNYTGTYYEPFLGSGAVFLGLNPDKWIISDLNKDLMNIWNTVKDSHKEIIKNFKSFSKKFKPLKIENKKNACRDIINTIESLPFTSERAIKYLLMKYCVFMGNLMVKDKMTFVGLEMNVYNNKYNFLNDNYYNNITRVSNKLQKGKILTCSYEKIINKTKEGDFVFLDPPYIEDINYQFSYNKGEMLGVSFIQELLDSVKLLDQKKVKWLMTQADTKQIRTVFKKYKITSFEVYRNRSNIRKKELLIRNY